MGTAMDNYAQAMGAFITARADADDSDEAIREEAELAGAVIDATRPLVIALEMLATYAHGEEIHPDCDEREWPGGADMVDYVNEMLTRLGVEPSMFGTAEPDEQTFGCVECNWTGLHCPTIDDDDRVVIVEQHDECDMFGSDLVAAQFVALCHPRFRWIVYVTPGVDEYEGIDVVKFVDAHKPLADDLPARQHDTYFYLCTDDALVELGMDLIHGREVTR